MHNSKPGIWASASCTGLPCPSSLPDKNYESLRQRLAAVFARYYVIFDKVWSGRETGDSEKELDAIAKEADEVLAGLTAWLDARASEIDDPYKE